MRKLESLVLGILIVYVSFLAVLYAAAHSPAGAVVALAVVYGVGRIFFIRKNRKKGGYRRV